MYWCDPVCFAPPEISGTPMGGGSDVVVCLLAQGPPRNWNVSMPRLFDRPAYLGPGVTMEYTKDAWYSVNSTYSLMVLMNVCLVCIALYGMYREEHRKDPPSELTEPLVVEGVPVDEYESMKYHWMETL